MRKDLKLQEARKNEKRQQKEAQKELMKHEFLENANREYLGEKKSAEVLSYRREQYIKNRDEGRVPTQIRADIDIEDDREVGALIQQYWDYVNKGWIRAESGLTQYEIAEFMTMERTELEMRNAVKQADEWRTATEAKERKRLEEHMERTRNLIQF